MKARQTHEEGGRKTFVLVLGKGDEVVSGIAVFVSEKKEHEEIPIQEEQVEVPSMVGDTAGIEVERAR